MEEIQKIHERLYLFLNDYRNTKDDKLFFSYRKSNISGYLEMGYWFLGDNQKVILTFWTGISWLTRNPSLAFVINSDGQILFEMSLDHQGQKDELLLGNILPRFNFNRRDNEIYYIDLGRIENFESILGEFIQNIKKEIDYLVDEFSGKFIKDQVKLTDTIGFIDHDEFYKNERKIKNYREQFIRSEKFENSAAPSIKKPSYLKSFKINNFALIKEVELNEIPIGNRWIFLIGENGSGKTLILKALSLALAQAVVPNKYIQQKNEPSNFKMSLLKNNGETIEYKRFGNDDKAKYAKSPGISGFAAYGTFRHEVKNARSRLKNIPLSKNGSLESIMSDDNVVSLINFSKILTEWGKNQKEYQKFEQRKYYLVNTLIEIVPGLVDIHFNKAGKNIIAEYFIRNDENVIALKYDQLSSGTRSILSLVADIFLRFYDQQLEINDPSEFKGIVIIDEIDLHLHPIGQKEVVINLNKVFPNIQFIVSTHSPIPLLGAPERSLFLRVKIDDRSGIILDRLYHIEQYIGELLPNHLLTSDLFGLESITSVRNKDKSNVFTGKSMEEYYEYNKLKKDINIHDADNEAVLEMIKARFK